MGPGDEYLNEDGEMDWDHVAEDYGHDYIVENYSQDADDDDNLLQYLNDNDY